MGSTFAPVTAPRSITPLGPRADRSETTAGRPSDYDRGSDRYPPRQPERDRGDRRDRDYDRNDLVDGSYGFEDKMDTDDNDSNKKGGLYSDNMITNQGRGRGNYRGRSNAGGNDRGRGYR